MLLFNQEVGGSTLFLHDAHEFYEKGVENEVTRVFFFRHFPLRILPFTFLSWESGIRHWCQNEVEGGWEGAGWRL